MSMRSRVLAVLIATLTLLLSSCDDATQLRDLPDAESTATRTVDENVATQRPLEPGDLSGTVNALNQLGDGQTVVISRAETEGPVDAWAVVYDDVDGAPGRPLGYARIPAAGEGSLTVELDEPLTETGSHPLWVVVHIDAEPTEQFDPGVDAAMTLDGDTLRDEFTYTVTSS